MFIHPIFINFNLYDNDINNLICRDDFDLEKFLAHDNIYISLWFHSKDHITKYFSKSILFDPDESLKEFHEFFREVTGSEKRMKENLSRTIKPSIKLKVLLQFIHSVSQDRTPVYKVDVSLKEGYTVTEDEVMVSPLQDFIMQKWFNANQKRKQTHYIPDSSKTAFVKSKKNRMSEPRLLDLDNFAKNEIHNEMTIQS